MDNRGEDRGDRKRPSQHGDQRPGQRSDRPSGNNRERRPESGSRDGDRRSHGDRKPWGDKTPNRAPRGDSRDRSDRAPRGEGRPPRFEKDDKPFRPQGGPRNRELAAVQDVDEELLRLIMRRARLLAKLRTGDRIDPGVEKALRTSWEEKAARLSRDSRLARDLFAILQAVEPLSRQEEEQAFFNLAPRREPADITLPAPANAMAARCWLALAAATGQKIELRDIPLTDNVIDAVKALNQLGGQLWWEESGTILSRGGKGLISGMDKVIHVGDDPFNLWLVLALSLGVPSRLKLTGGSPLRFLDLAPVRHFLPDLGARLTNVIPGQDGLPARVECSGMLGVEIRLPDDLPPAFIAALLLAAPFWERAATLILPASSPLADMTLAVLAEAGASVKRDGLRVTVAPGGLQMPAQPKLPMDASFAASLLAIPAFVGGAVRLEGLWPHGELAANAETLLRAADIALTMENDGITARREIPEGSPAVAYSLDQVASRTLLEQSPALLPLAAALAGAAVLRGGQAFLPMTEQAVSDEGENVLSGFLSRLGVQADENGALSITPVVDVENGGETPAMRGAWISPTPLWAVGMALAAFAKPNIHLANPGVMTDLFPAFWNLYNGLPKPDLTRKKPTEEADVKPVRRRIIAQGVYGELPPDPPAGDYD